jgi:putative DNA primase/helicase
MNSQHAKNSKNERKFMKNDDFMPLSGVDTKLTTKNKEIWVNKPGDGPFLEASEKKSSAEILPGPEKNGDMKVQKDDEYYPCLPDGLVGLAELLHATDRGNALRLISHYGDRIRYCQETSLYYVFHEGIWVPDHHKGYMRELGKEISDRFIQELTIFPDTNTKEMKANIKKLGTSGGLDSMAEMARTDPRVEIALDKFDARPLLLNVTNGTLDLSTGNFREFCREDYLTRRIPVEYKPEATCDKWLKFIAEFTCEDKDLENYLQKLLGYCSTGETKEQCFFWFKGDGMNGKSTFVETVSALLGDYATTLSAASFSKSPAHLLDRKDLIGTKGSRVVTISEWGNGFQIFEALLKQYTGEDAIAAGGFKQQVVTFRPQAKVIAYANNYPEINETNKAMKRRLKIIPCNFKVERKDSGLKNDLKAELSGILNWVIEGCRKYREEGLKEPNVVDKAIETFFTSKDTVDIFIKECCQVDSIEQFPLKTAYARYLECCSDCALRALGKTAFATKLEEKGYSRVHSGKRFWRGIGPKRGV